MSNPKLSKGIVVGSPGVIQTGNNGKVFVAEGPETALSIAEAEPNATVLCAFSVNNYKKMAEAIKSYAPSEIIIAGDNDGVKSNAYQITEKARDELAQQTQLPVVTIYPNNLSGKEKTDFNDVLVQLGKKSLSDMIARGLKAEKEIDTGLIEKYRHAIDMGLPLDNVSHLAKIVGRAQSEFKLDSQKYNELASLLNKSNDVNKIIDDVQALGRDQVKIASPLRKSRGEVELEI